MRSVGLASLLAALAAAVGGSACAGDPAPPGTSSYYCTCECGLFMLGVALPDSTRFSPRFEVCLDEDTAPSDERLFARDILDLCDDACRGTISEAVRRVACIDRPDLCESIACADNVCISATNKNGDVFDPRVDDAGTLEVPDGGLVGFGFAASCRGPPDAGFPPCAPSDCALDDVRAVATCGDEVLQDGELCDGRCNVYDVCPTLMPGTHGFVQCNDVCGLDGRSCVALELDAGQAPDTSDCVARNEGSLQRKIHEVLAGCSVIPELPPVGECEREETRPLCLAQ